MVFLRSHHGRFFLQTSSSLQTRSTSIGDMRQEYELLPTDESAGALDDAIGSDSSSRVQHNRLFFSSVLPALFALLCTLANFALWYAGRTGIGHPHASALLTRLSSSLERPSTYIGLDKLTYDRISESHRQFANFPFLLTQISKVEPELVWADDSKQKLTSIGSISPDSRRFMLTPEISSVAQFRVVDYGYENCSLNFALQSSAKQLPLAGASVDIWSLSMSSSRLDATRLSWTSRPSRREKLGMVMLAPNASVELERTWPCKWGEFQTFEFACAMDEKEGERRGCNVDFWQDPKVPSLGVTMTQRSSLAGA
ncbi:hypothetical protein EW146_g7116 [Bondarzewia mesenterica]|uniref:Uncharacterized protein n=1 Tax=Bondarzewia mesenterica TaxID=1095465 RepID=A0A4S4LLV4_9AGAM|nr:hypothetical protein EW146_g7116 [Bondarzewia mesenterica]